MQCTDRILNTTEQISINNMEHEFRIMHQHSIDDMSKFKRTMHHYTGFFSSLVLAEVPNDFVYIGDLREKFNIDNSHIWTYDYDGHQLHYQLAPTFTTTRRLKSGTFIRDCQDRIVSIVTKSYFDGHVYKYVISSFHGARGRLTGTALIEKEKPQNAMIYGEHAFKNKNDLVRFVDEASEGSIKIILYLDRCGSDNRISIVSGAIEISHLYLAGKIVNCEHSWNEDHSTAIIPSIEKAHCIMENELHVKKRMNKV